MGLFVQNIEPVASASSISDNNIINSVVEYVSEVILNKVNAVPENSKDGKDQQAHKHMTIKMIEFKKLPLAILFKIDSFKIDNSLSQNDYYRFYKEINLPPPRA